MVIDGIYYAIALSAGGAAVWYLSRPLFAIPLFVLALAFTWLYETTDCLLAPIFGHVLFNAAGLVLIKFVPQ